MATPYTSCEIYRQPLFRRVAGSEFRPGGMALTEELAGCCGLEAGGRVLDLGCGVGSTASYLARELGVEVVGLDRSPLFLAEAEARDASVAWVEGDAQSIPFPNDSFDAVLAECFLSTVDDRGKVLAEIRRVLKPRGRLAITDMYLRDAPAINLRAGSLPPACCLHGAVDETTMRSSLEAAGFKTTVWRDRSRVLAAFTASLILSYGSAAEFWEATVGSEEGARERVASARPGYCLVVAKAGLVQPNPVLQGPGPRPADVKSPRL